MFRIALSELRASVGAVEQIEIQLCRMNGNFGAFCTVEMKTKKYEETLSGKYEFKQFGTRIYLPRELPVDFERRALARVA